MSYQTPSSYEDRSQSDLIEVLTEHARAIPQAISKYVCHTSTIPLATMIDIHHWYNVLTPDARSKKTVRTFHSFHPEYAHTQYVPSCCPRRTCMFTRRNKGPRQKKPISKLEKQSEQAISESGKSDSGHSSDEYQHSSADDSQDTNESRLIRTVERVRRNCPCLDKTMETIDGDIVPLQPICWSTFIKSLNCKLVGRLHDSDSHYIQSEEVMFCHDSAGILDSSYPGYVRDDIKVTGWHNVKTRDQLFTLLTWTYWFRRYGMKYKAWNKIDQALDTMKFWQVKAAITQTLHTLNGMLMKKFFALGPEISDYRSIADQTAQLFVALFADYTQVTVYDYLGRPHEPTGLTYQSIKAHLNDIKQSFHRQKLEERISWLDLSKVTNKSLKYFLKTEYSRLSRYIGKRNSSELSDYTLSPAYIFRCATLCQTRVVGYLPPALAEAKRWQFRDNISREYEPLPEVKREFIYSSVMNRLSRAFPAGEMANWDTSLPVDGETLFENLTEAVGNISLVLKGSASTYHTVSSGGKIEEARQLIKKARDNQWSVPIRSLSTGNETGEFISFFKDMEPVEPQRHLFWLSYQLTLNWAIRNGLWARRKDYLPLPDGEEEYTPDIMDASIVHISEPGKERNLTKCTGVYAWFLTPASKVTQKVLSRLDEHRAGLEASSHDWSHQKRISVESNESGFIYDTDGKSYEGIRNSFKDWTESTDFISKRVGWALVGAIFDYISFPRAYKSLVQLVILLPQPVTEVIHLHAEDETSEGYIFESTRIKWTGFIREGFMMGNPLTKTILHSCHIPELEFSTEYLRRAGLNVPGHTSGPPSLVSRPKLNLSEILEQNEYFIDKRPPSNGGPANAFSGLRQRRDRM